MAAFPPNFPREEAINILKNFRYGNPDGTGYSYVRNGKFVTHKWPLPLKKVLKNEKFLAHMPYDGWTIAHLRAASHGDISNENTHPFIIGDEWAFMHNGIWFEYNVVRLALEPFFDFKGETDSEVAAYLFSLAGPERFAEEIDTGGVFIALNKNGELWVVKTSGDLEIIMPESKIHVLASEFDMDAYPDRLDAFSGWFHFGKNGKYIEHHRMKKSHYFLSPPKYKSSSDPKKLGTKASNFKWTKFGIYRNPYQVSYPSPYQNSQSSARDPYEVEL
jgi:hypothetical protein